MLREEIVEQWKKLKKSFIFLRSKSIDKFKGKLIRNISSVELRPNTYGEGFSEWASDILVMKGYWNSRTIKDFTQKVVIHFEIQEISEVLELLEDQTEEDRKNLRTKSDGSLSDSDLFSETNLTSWFSIDDESKKRQAMLNTLKREANKRDLILNMRMNTGNEINDLRVAVEEETKNRMYWESRFNSLKNMINNLEEYD